MPTFLVIDDKKIPVKTWTDVTVEFIRFLLAANLLKKHMLPFCPDSGTSKAYVNSVPMHPVAELDCKFTPVAENVYVDTKWNAQSHISKIVKSLEKLGAPTKYSISITFK